MDIELIVPIDFLHINRACSDRYLDDLIAVELIEGYGGRDVGKAR